MRGPRLGQSGSSEGSLGGRAAPLEQTTLKTAVKLKSQVWPKEKRENERERERERENERTREREREREEFLFSWTKKKKKCVELKRQRRTFQFFR